MIGRHRYVLVFTLMLPAIAAADPGLPPAGYVLERASSAVPETSVSGITQLAFRPGDPYHLFAVRTSGAVTRYDLAPASGFLSNPVDVVSNLPVPLGLAFRDSTLYVSLNPSGDSRISRLRDLDQDGLYEERDDFVRGVPNRDHGIDQLQILGSTLYAPIGTRWNSGDPTCEGTVYTGTLARIADLDQIDYSSGSNYLPSEAEFIDPTPSDGYLRRYASGFRNPFGLRVDSKGEIWVSDNGASACSTCSSCSNFPIDTPDLFYADVPLGARGEFPPDGYPGGGGSTMEPLSTLLTHAAATGFDWITLGPDAGRIVLAQFGASNANVQAGHDLVMLDPQTGSESSFVEGLMGPTDVKSAPDGRLYVADYSEPAVYILTPPSWTAVEGLRRPAALARIIRITPDPARVSLRVEYTLPHRGPVTWSVVDAAGRMVARLHDPDEVAGTHVQVWALQGMVPAPGLYFVCLETAGDRDMRRVVVVR